jgi:hypothetical protein
VGTPVLSVLVALAADGISTGAPTVGTPALTHIHVLTADGVATGAPTVGEPALTQTHILDANGIATGAPTVGEPAIAQVHVLTATGVATGAPTVGEPAIAQTHVLTATGIDTGAPTVGTPVLAEGNGTTDALTATGIATGAPTVGTPILRLLGVTYALTATGITATPTVGAPWLARPVPPHVPAYGSDFGYGAAVQKVGDTRWQGVREAREMAAAAFREVEKAPARKRKVAAEKAIAAVGKVAQSIRPPVTQLPQLDNPFDDVASDLEALMAQLEALAAQQQAIRAQQAREAAAAWARIEQELRLEQETVEELAIVLALAL